MSVKRFDTGGLGKPTRTPQGYLKVDAYLTRTGIFIYKTPDGGIRRELRLPDDVFHADSLKSFAMAPVTNGHPPEMLTAENTREHQRGHLGETIVRDGDRVRATMLVTDAELIAEMESGKNEISNGYICDLDETPGVYRGEKYDARQLNIVANHTAVVPNGRAGAGCAARMDSGDAFGGLPIPEEQGMTEKEIKELQAKLDAAEAENARLKSEASKSEARADSAAQKLEAATSARKVAEDAEKRRADMRARMSLEKTAAKILGDEVKLDDLEDIEIKVAVVEKVTEKKLDSKKAQSAEYVEIRFDHALELAEKADAEDGDDAVDAVRAAGEDVARRDAGERNDSVKKYCDALPGLYKQPISGAFNRGE